MKKENTHFLSSSIYLRITKRGKAAQEVTRQVLNSPFFVSILIDRQKNLYIIFILRFSIVRCNMTQSFRIRCFKKIKEDRALRGRILNVDLCSFCSIFILFLQFFLTKPSKSILVRSCG